MPTFEFYHRYVDDTITKQRIRSSADCFLSTLNNCHSSLKFTIECANDGKIPFLAMKAIKEGDRIATKVYVKPTNTGSYTLTPQESRSTPSIQLSSSWKLFTDEFERLKKMFCHLQYPPSKLVNGIIKDFVEVQYEKLHGETDGSSESQASSMNIIPFTLPFKDQKTSDMTRRQRNNRGLVIGLVLRQVFHSKKVINMVRVPEQNRLL